jgi:hypothetical protein
MKNIILGIVFFGAIMCMVYFFVIEGFSDSGSMTAGDQLQAKCAANSTCSTCLATPNCGWAPEYADPVSGLQGVADGTVLACIPMSGGRPSITTNLLNLMLKKNGAISILKKFINTVADCMDITCSEQKTCVSCPKYKKCLWQQLTAADGTVTQSCIDLSGAPAADASHNNIVDMSKCPPPQCSDLTDCQDCTNTTGCGFCTISGICLKSSQFGSGTSQCPTASLVTMPAKCPCSGITDCAKCAGRVGCGYCKGIKQCVNLDRYGMPPMNTCSADDTATSDSQCSPAATLQKGAESARNPTPENLSAAQDSGIIDRASGFNLSATQNIGSGAVSPVQSYKIVSAPGVARPAGASSVPAPVAGLHDSPLEAYVKMLVNSQLAAQGIPTNEPFQVTEESAIPNATEYLKKVFRGVFH